jgi:two-component system, NarL family, response regulator YdfI
MIRVIVTSAYASVRAGLQSMLAADPEISVVSAVGGSGELNRVLPDANANVVLYDDDPGDRGSLIDAVSKAQIALVLLTDDRLAPVRLASGRIAGWSCLLREADSAELIASTHAAAAGLISIDSSLLPSLTGELSATKTSIRGELPDPMTARELEVLQLLAQGLPNKVIANRLQISQHTVKFHVAGILSKLNAGSRTEAVTVGARRGFVTF